MTVSFNGQRNQVLFLLKAFTFEPKNLRNPKVELKVGDAVVLVSNALTHMVFLCYYYLSVHANADFFFQGGAKQTLFGTLKPYYKIQLADRTSRPKVWRSNLYYSVESNVFEVL